VEDGNFCVYRSFIICAFPALSIEGLWGKMVLTCSKNGEGKNEKVEENMQKEA
jgi:hypothetical protein